MLRRTAAIILMGGLLGGIASAQESRSPFARLFATHFDSMQRDTFVARWGHDKTLGDLLPDGMLFRMSDSAVVMLSLVLVNSFRQVPLQECAAFAPIGTKAGLDLMGLADQVDSPTAVQWVAVMHQMMLTGLYNLPRGRALPPDSVFVALREMTQRWPVDERQRVERAMSDTRPTQAERCFKAKLLFGSLAAMPPRQAGPLFRGLMAMGGAR